MNMNEQNRRGEDRIKTSLPITLVCDALSQEIQSTVTDISLGGHSCVLEKELPLNIDFVQANFSNFKADCQVVWRDDSAKKYGLKFKESYPQTATLIEEIENSFDKEKEVFSKISYLFNLSKEISPEFKSMIDEFRHQLESIKLALNQFELQIQSYSEEKQKIVSERLLQFLETKLFKKFDELLILMNNSTDKISEQDYKKYGEYFRLNLHSLLLDSPFIERVYTKPLGYAGDYEMMNMIYRNAYEGKTLFGKFLNKYSLSILPAQTNRNRIPYIIEKIKTLVPEFLKNQERVKITNIACGPCIEIQRLLSDKEFKPFMDKIDFTLLDISPEAIAHAQQKVTDLKNKYQSKATFKFINDSVYHLTKNKDILESEQNLIYSLGLFEYLSDIFVKRLIKELFTKLTLRGILIIGNYSNQNPFKLFMELGGNWFLHYRDSESLAICLNAFLREFLLVDQDKKIDFNKFFVIKK